MMMMMIIIIVVVTVISLNCFLPFSICALIVSLSVFNSLSGSLSSVLLSPSFSFPACFSLNVCLKHLSIYLHIYLCVYIEFLSPFRLMITLLGLQPAKVLPSGAWWRYLWWPPKRLWWSDQMKDYPPKQTIHIFLPIVNRRSDYRFKNCSGNAKGCRNPCVIKFPGNSGMLAYLRVTSPSLSFLRRKHVYLPVTVRPPFDSLHSAFLSPCNVAASSFNTPPRQKMTKLSQRRGLDFSAPRALGTGFPRTSIILLFSEDYSALFNIILRGVVSWGAWLRWSWQLPVPGQCLSSAILTANLPQSENYANFELTYPRLLVFALHWKQVGKFSKKFFFQFGCSLCQWHTCVGA